MLMIRCPKCTQTLQVADEHRGKVVRCSKCGQSLQIPAAAPPPVRPVAPAPQAALPAAAQPPPPVPAPAAPEPETLAFADLSEPVASRRSAAVPEPAEEFPELGRTIEEFLPRQWWIWLCVSAALMVIAAIMLILANPSKNKVLAVPAVVII